MEFQAVKGMRDILPEEFNLFKHVIAVVQQIFDNYGYQELAMPILEPFELFAAKSGEEIKDTMYVFEDKAGRKLALRPEMTASIARLYITYFMKGVKKPLRLAYMGPCYRYDNPQYGRYREFRQAGLELLGSEYPEADAEILIACDDLMTRLGFTTFHLKVGHVGILREILAQEGMNEEFQNRILSLMDRNKIEEVFQLFQEQNLPANVINIIKELVQLKGKNIQELIEQASVLLESYSQAMSALQNLKEILTLYLSYEDQTRILVDFGFARGLEYYTGMIFEIFIEDLSIAVGGGGRYDNLIANFQGEPTPAVGCAPGIDRIVLAMTEKKLFAPTEDAYAKKIMVACLDEIILPEALKIAQTVRKGNYSTEFDVGRKKLKNLLTFAANKKIRYVIIVGSKEIVKKEVMVRDLALEKQETVPIDDLMNYLKEKIGNGN
jgi:histidyl-tRNA synthetase